MTEYSTTVTTIDLKPEIHRATGEQVTQTIRMSLGVALRKTSASLEKLDGGGWHILSHQLTMIDNHLVASFLLRR